MKSYKQRIMKQRKIIELYHKLIQNYISGYAELFGDIDEYFDDVILFEQMKKAVDEIDDIIEKYLFDNFEFEYCVIDYTGWYKWHISDNLFIRKQIIKSEVYYVLYHKQSGQKICVIHVSQIPIIIQFDKPKYTGLTKENYESDEYKDLRDFFKVMDNERRYFEDGYYDHGFRAETAKYDFMDEGK